MNKVNRWLQNYLVCALPFVLACVAWSATGSEREILNGSSFLLRMTWEILAWNLIFWFFCLVVFLLLMLFVPSTRDMVTRRIANVKERDEREIYITGQASKKTFLSTLSVLIFLLFISIFTFNITKIPPNEVVDGHERRMSITFNFKLMDDPKIERNESGQVLFESKDLPLSKSSILLLLIVWQVAMFALSARKIANEE
jgi:hypothetical protein